MSIIEIEVRGTSTANYKEALDQATRSAKKSCEDLVDLDEVSRFVEIDGGSRRFGVTLKATCLRRDWVQLRSGLWCTRGPQASWPASRNASPRTTQSGNLPEQARRPAVRAQTAKRTTSEAPC